MLISTTILIILLTAVQACTKCPHPGVFTGKLALFTNPTSAYCTLEDVPANATYASVSADFFNPPDESPCDAPINVTNPITKKTIQAIVVGQCKTCTGNGLFLTQKGFDELQPVGRARKTPTAVEWTFASPQD